MPALLDLLNVTKLFLLKRQAFSLRGHRFVHAVDGVSFSLEPREIFGLVGESGCGKTTTGKLIVKLYEPTSGRIFLDGQDITQIRRGPALRQFRRSVQMIFQDPYESLNPRFTVFDAVAEPLLIHGVRALSEREARVAEILAQVGLTPPETFLFRFPHELSGGQRQRVAIARAMVIHPKCVVADEPTSMLDVSVRAGVMDLLLGLRQELGVSYLYITHDLAVARYMSDRLAVMYLGKIVELGPTEEVIQSPQHPYTQALLAAVPVPDPTYQRPSPAIKGDVVAPVNPPLQCRFLSRCPRAEEVCRDSPHPPLADLGSGHLVACYLARR
jgi:peptide/nickel transport system ATP-binding protein